MTTWLHVPRPRRSARPVALALLALAACAACSKPPPAAPRPPVPVAKGSPIVAAVLAAHVCAALRDRVIALPSGEGPVASYAEVKDCSAKAQGASVSLHLVAYAWLATDQDIAGVKIAEFVHATVDATTRLAPLARYVGEHVEIELRPEGASQLAVEPVGALDIAPLNWASLLGDQLAPSAGTTGEWVAKGAVRTEAGRALTEAIGNGAVVAYDARRDVSWLVSPAAPTSASAPPREPPKSEPGKANARVLVVPGGSAWLGPFEPAREVEVRVRLERGSRLAAKPMCRDYAERLLDADRRGDRVRAQEWVVFGPSGERVLPLPACPWVLALRSLDDVPVIANVDASAKAHVAASLSAITRWVALDDVSVELGRDDPTTEVWLLGDTLQTRIHPPPRHAGPVLAELADGDGILVRAVDTSQVPPVTLAEGRLVVDPAKDGPVTVSLFSTSGGTAVVRARARSRPAAPR